MKQVLILIVTILALLFWQMEQTSGATLHSQVLHNLVSKNKEGEDAPIDPNTDALLRQLENVCGQDNECKLKLVQLIEEHLDARK
jgi:hypothetical protein